VLQLPLGPLALGDVLDERAEVLISAGPDPPYRHLDRELVAVAVQAVDLHPAVRQIAFFGEQTIRGTIVSVPVPRRNDGLGQRSSDGLVPRPPEGRLRTRVPVGDAPATVHAHEGVPSAVDDAASPLLAHPQGLVSPPPLGDVAGDGGAADHLAVGRPHRERRDRNFHDAAALHQPLALERLDTIASTNPSELGLGLRHPVGRNEDREGPAGDLFVGVPVQASRALVPAGDHSLGGPAVNGVVGGLHNGCQAGQLGL